MTVYYCDLDHDFADQTGADKIGNEYYGPGGLRNAITGDGANATALVAGDILYLKDTATLSLLVDATVDVDKTGTWVIGDALENHNDGGGIAGDNWAGVLVFIDATSVIFQINAGADFDAVDTADGIDNVTRTETIAGANMTSAITPGILPNNNSGDLTSGHIKLIGVKSDWSVMDPTVAAEWGSLDFQAVLDGTGMSAGSECMTGTTIDRWWLENLTFQNAPGSGLGGASAADNWVMYHCLFANNTADGINSSSNFRWAVRLYCIFDGNVNAEDFTSGFAGYCLCRDNTGSGLSPYGATLYHVLNYGNGTDNVWIRGTSSILNAVLGCVMSGSTSGSGVRIDANMAVVLESRMVSANQYGIEMDAAVDDSNIEEENLFWGNGVSDLKNIVSGRLSYGDGANHIADDHTDDGLDASYQVETGKYNRSTERVMNWDEA